MPEKLKRWTRRVLRLEDADSRDGPPRRSPAPRPRPLTASPSRKSLTASASAAASNSPFFRKLPPEIRRPILIEAFGERIIHMERITHNVSALAAVAAATGSSLAELHGPDPTAQRRLREVHWQWRGSLCHRAPEGSLRSWGLEQSYLSQPFECPCLTSRGGACPDWLDKVPESCWLGVMGWLLSCRQAYTEGIDVFYGMNTFHFRGTEFLSELPTAFVPDRLAMIDSVELVWDFKLSHNSEEPCEPFVRLLRNSPACFPNLKRVHVAPHLDWSRTSFPTSEACYKGWTTDILTPVAEMMHALPKLEKCILSVPFLVFRYHLRSRNMEVENSSYVNSPRPFRLAESRIPHEGDTFVVPTPISPYLDPKANSPEEIEGQTHRCILVIEGVYHSNVVSPCFGECKISTDSPWLWCGGIVP